MATEIDHLRSELEGEGRPPVEVMLDPSLLVSVNAFARLKDSILFEAQNQATLGGTPTRPRVNDIYVPGAFRDLIETNDQKNLTTTAAWNFYRGQSESASRTEIIDLLASHHIQVVSGSLEGDLNWAASLDSAYLNDRLVQILVEQLDFLAGGGILLSRTSSSLDALRDAGVPTIDLGAAELSENLHQNMTDIGYDDPASFCAFGMSSATTLVDGLVGNVLSDHADVLFYRIRS